MQEEVNEKTLWLCIKGGKITAEVLRAALLKLLSEMEKKKQQSKGEKSQCRKTGKQTYAISIKVPAIQVEFRRMLPFEDENGGKLSYTLNGTLYPDEQVVIYDIGDVKPEAEKKRRGRRKKSEIEAEQKGN